MISFFVCLAILIIGFMLYSKVAEKVFGPDDRKPPALSMTDGSDYVPMGTPRIFLIQLLNIAGLGPIFGALAGACWGPSVFLWITFGTLLGGGVHDYMVGMMGSCRAVIRNTAVLSATEPKCCMLIPKLL